MKHLLILLSALLLLPLSSCRNSLERALKPDSSGTPYDLYLVMEEALRETALNDTLHAIFEFPMEGTPNGDEYFRVRHLTPENFASQVIRIVANVAIVDINPTNGEQPVVTLEREPYAYNQVIVRMHAKTIESLTEYLPQIQQQLRQVYVKNEMNRRIKIITKEHLIKQQDRLMRLQNASLYIPRAMDVTCRPAKDSTFFWCTDNFASKQSYLVVYSVPYTDQNIFTLEGAVAVRDSVMGANIEGSDSTQHMETNRNVVLPEYKALNVGGHYVGELRGMWRMRNGLMAGPFICHIRLDEVNKRVVFAEGFCYAPNDGKRLLIRNLEASLYTLKLPSDQLIPEIEVSL